MRSQYYIVATLLTLAGIGPARAQLNGAGGPAGPWVPFTASLWSTAMADSGGPYQPHQYKSIKFADVNGDGIADLCYRFVPAVNARYQILTGGIKCALTGRGQFGAATTWTLGFSSNWSDNEYYWGTIQYADINGDGKADVCGRWIDGIYCALSTGSSFGPVTMWTSGYSDANGWNADPSYWKTIRFVDVNGDGKADVCGRGWGGIQCSLSTGSAFGGAILWSSQYSNPNSWQSDPKYWSTIQFADLNGDGKMDVCGRGGAGMVCAVSDGSQFVNLAVWTTQFSDANNWIQPQFYQTIQLADIDGDGKADVCGRGAAGVYCGRSTGSSFGNDAFTVGANAFSDAAGFAAAQYYQTIRVVDVDGDGKADVCGRGYEYIWCQISRSTSTQTSFAPALQWVSNFGDNFGWGDSESHWGTIKPARLSVDPYTRRYVNGFCGRGSDGIVCTDTIRLQADAAYDWSANAKSTWDAGFAAFAQPLVWAPPPPGITIQVAGSRESLIDALGFTGSYDGTIYSSASTNAHLTLKSFGGAVHGGLTILQPNLSVDGGFCGQFPIPLGTVAVNMTNTGPTTLFVPYRNRFDASGSTTRQVSYLGLFSGQVVVNFNMTLYNYANLTSEIFGTIQIHAPSPCQSSQLSVYFKRRNNLLFQAFGRS